MKQFQFSSLLSGVGGPHCQRGLPDAEVAGGGLGSDGGRRGLRRVERGRLELAEEEPPDEGAAVPRLRERQDLGQPPHVVPAKDRYEDGLLRSRVG